MARQLNVGIETASTTPARGERWKAKAYLNFYITERSGKRTKVGTIPLYDHRTNDAKFVNWLNENPEENAKKLLNNLEMLYVPVEETEGGSIDL